MLYTSTFKRLPATTRRQAIAIAKSVKGDLLKVNRKECRVILATGQELIVKF